MMTVIANGEPVHVHKCGQPIISQTWSRGTRVSSSMPASINLLPISVVPNSTLVTENVKVTGVTTSEDNRCLAFLKMANSRRNHREIFVRVIPLDGWVAGHPCHDTEWKIKVGPVWLKGRLHTEVLFGGLRTIRCGTPLWEASRTRTGCL